VVLVALFGSLVAQHPLLRPQRFGLWRRCWTEGSTVAVRDRLSLERGTLFATDWPQLARIKSYLQSQGVSDSQLTCYCITSIPLYQELDINPATPFLFLGSAIYFFPHHRHEMHELLAQSGQRFVVSDLRFFYPTKALADDESRPVRLPRWALDCYPWSERLVYRAGRYLVHQVVSRPQDMKPFAP
jgi:hypothetical protein